MIRGRSFCIALLWLCLFCLAVSAQPVKPQGQTQGGSPVRRDNSTYRQLVERAKKGDATVDFVQLREAFVDWASDAKNQTSAPNRDAMVDAFKAQNHAKAVELAEIVLDYEFINRGLHLATEDAYRRLGDETKADFHHDMAEKLLKALLSTGDGKSPETAYRVLSIAEEYLIMRELGYGVSSQSLLSIKNKAYDLLSWKDPQTGRTVDVYFDISSFFGK